MRIKKITYFHPRGERMSNGCHFQRGGYLCECRTNKTKFLHNDKSERHGGIIVLPSSLKGDDMDDGFLAEVIGQRFLSFTMERWIDSLKSLLASLFNRERESTPMSCRMGHLFTGEYVSEKGERYDKSSFCVELNDAGRRQLFSFAKHLALRLGLSDVLVRESGRGRIYLVNS